MDNNTLLILGIAGAAGFFLWQKSRNRNAGPAPAGAAASMPMQGNRPIGPKPDRGRGGRWGKQNAVAILTDQELQDLRWQRSRQPRPMPMLGGAQPYRHMRNDLSLMRSAV